MQRIWQRRLHIGRAEVQHSNPDDKLAVHPLCLYRPCWHVAGAHAFMLCCWYTLSWGKQGPESTSCHL